MEQEQQRSAVMVAETSKGSGCISEKGVVGSSDSVVESFNSLEIDWSAVLLL